MSRLRVVFLVIVGGLVLACGQGDTARSYEQEIKQTRVQRDMRLRGKESVLAPDRRDAFRGLDFYRVDSTYRFVVPLRRFSSPDTVMIAESTGGLRSQTRVGRVTVPLPTGKEDLAVFRGEGDDSRGRLWIPFSDSTNGKTTYEGGRYVDLNSVGTDSVVVDFNRTYNPTCVYDPDYACPVPPPENRIDAPVPAGEKMPLFRTGKAS